MKADKGKKQNLISFADNLINIQWWETYALQDFHVFFSTRLPTKIDTQLILFVNLQINTPVLSWRNFALVVLHVISMTE